MPPSEQARRDRIEAALATDPRETHRVTFRGKTELLPVITIEIADTVLNHRSHRIRAQLEGESSADAIRASPETEESQETIRRLLRQTPGFEPLKENLEADGQRDPGVVTVSGLLINANTRSVALRDLGKTHIDVAVLPSDATIPELYALEADLQVAADYRQDYSFTNELLFVFDLITEHGRSEEDVALQLRWATPGRAATITRGVEQVRRYTRHLSFIREIQALSGAKVPLIDFDNAAQTLQEFDARYEGQRVKDPDGAAEMKTAQLLALLADLGYQASREIKPGWVDEHLNEAILENPVLRAVYEAGDEASPPEESPLEGLDVLDELQSTDDVGVASNAARTVATLVERLGKSATDVDVVLPTPRGDETFARQSVLDAVQDAMKAAAESAKEAAAQGDAVRAAVTRVQDATRRLGRAGVAYAAAHQDPAFDRPGFEEAVAAAERAVDALKQQAGL